jgi:hypothetical protein
MGDLMANSNNRIYRTTQIQQAASEDEDRQVVLYVEQLSLHLLHVLPLLPTYSMRQH